MEQDGVKISKLFSLGKSFCQIFLTFFGPPQEEIVALPKACDETGFVSHAVALTFHQNFLSPCGSL
jgi:hypothetical protein